MEINTQQPNINQEIIPKKNFREANNVQTPPQSNGNNGAEGVEQSVGTNNLNGEEANVLVQNTNMSFKDQLEQLNAQNEIYDFSFDMDFGEVFTFNTEELDEQDINFFLDILEKNKDKQTVQNLGVTPNMPTVINVRETTETKSVQATEKIAQIMDIASKTGRPVRIDFDNQIMVVLRVDSDGKINAQFYPGDKAAEEYLRNNIQSLRNTFDKENILYSYLDYRQNKGNNGKERKDKQ